jgi:WD40 repeat protein
VTSVSFSPCGGRIASASRDGTIKVWEASTGTCQSTLSGHDGIVWSVYFSPDGKKIASSGKDKTVRIWDAATGASVGSPLRGHSDAVTSAAFNKEGTLLASSSHDKTEPVSTSLPPCDKSSCGQPASAIGAVRERALHLPHESSLPDGWVVCTSRSKGKAFYYHSASKRTQWHRPLS